MFTIWGAIRYLPDLLESIQATAKYGRWLYDHASAPRSVGLTITILVVGIALLFADSVKEHTGRWFPKRSNAETRSRTTAPMRPESRERVSQFETTITDGGSGEERRKTWENRPKLFLEYDAATATKYSLTYSGVFLKNSGGIAHNVHFQPEVRAGLSLEMEDPTGSVNANPFAVRFKACTVRTTGKKTPIGGPLAEQMTSLFEALIQEQEHVFEIAITCQDFEGNSFAYRTRFKYDQRGHQITSELAT